KYISRHQGELLAGDEDQDRLRDPQRQTALLDDRTRQIEIEKPVMGHDGAAAGRQMRRDSLKEAIEEGSPVRSSGAPAWQPATDLLRLHRKIREIGCDQVEAPPDNRLPHIAAVKLKIVATVALAT